MPEQWVLASLSSLTTIEIKQCTGLTSLDATSATALTSLTLEGLDSLKRVALPASLQELTCERLPALADVDLSAAPDVEAVFTTCPAIRLRYHKLRINP
jgi:hypothetical protein